MSLWASLAQMYGKTLVTRGFSERSREAYCGDLARFLGYLECHRIEVPGDLTREVLQAYQTDLFETPGRRGKRLSLGTQAHHLAAVRSFCEFLHERGLVLMDPARAIEMPRIARRLPAVILTTREVLRFLKVIDTSTWLGVRDRAMFETLYSTGMRVTELTQLAPGDVDLVEGFVTIRRGKGGKGRIVPLGRIAIRWIRRYLDTARPRLGPGCPLFVSARHLPLSRTFLSAVARVWAKAARLTKRVTCHAFRHACATHMLRARASLRHIQQLLGHADPGSTQIYTHVEIADLKRVHRRCHPRGHR